MGTEHAIAVANGIAIIVLVVVAILWYIVKYQRQKRRSDSETDSQMDDDDVDFRPEFYPELASEISPNNPIADSRRPRQVSIGRRGRVLAPISASSRNNSRYICAPSRPLGERSDPNSYARAASPPGERT